MEKSNNQEVKEGKISPWRRMRNILIPISCLLNATDNRTRQRLPKGWRDACKHWCCIEIQVLDRDRRRQFYQLHFHAMLVHLCAQLTLATVLVHATFHATVSHHTHHHLVIVKAVSSVCPKSIGVQSSFIISIFQFGHKDTYKESDSR